MNKIALVIGSSRGIGKQIGIDLLKKDYVVFFTGRDFLQLSNLTKELSKTYKNFRAIKNDFSNQTSARAFVKFFKQCKIKFDVIVFSAGTTDRTEFLKISKQSWENVINTNLTAPVMFLQDMYPLLNRKGSITFIGSIAGKYPDSVSLSYGVTKGALPIMTKYLAKAFSSKEIRVNNVAPGYILTDWHKDKSKEQLKRIANKCLAKRLGTTEEVSKAVLLTIENEYLNGETIYLDGGFGLCQM